MRKTITFVIATKNKIFRISLAKEVKDLYISNYQTLIKESEEDTNK
jgi:hypothetical protein